MPTVSNRKQLHSMLEDVMYQAIQTDIGIEVSTNDAQRLKQELNFCRRGLRQHGNYDYDALIFRTCPTDPESRVWIVRKVQALHDSDQ